MHRKTILFAKRIIHLAAFLLLALEGHAARLEIIGRHPTSPLTPFPAITVLKAFGDRIYMGYGDWLVFPSVTVASYDTGEGNFHLEFSPATDLIRTFREIRGVLYMPSTDPHFYDHNRDYSYLSDGVWRDAAPVGMYHVMDIGSVGASDLWLVGSKPINETGTFGPAVFRSADGGQNWADLTIPVNRNFGMYAWGFALQGRFYVYDAFYEGSTGTRSSAAPYIDLAKPTPIQQGTNQFVVAAAATTGTSVPVSLVTFDSKTWRTIRTSVFDFTVTASNLFTLQSGAIWMASALSQTGGIWQRLDFTNVPPDARVIEVAGRTVYIGDARGQLWAGHLDGAALNTNSVPVINDLSDGFGQSLAIDADLLAVGAPDYSGAVPLSGQVTVWQREGSAEGADTWHNVAVLTPPTPAFSGWFGKEVALQNNLLAVVESGRDVTGTNRSGSALVHVYERAGETFAARTNIALPFAQSVAFSDNWLAVGAGAPVGIAGNHLRLYRIDPDPNGIRLSFHTNFLAQARGTFWKPAARVALDGDICVLASTADVSFDGAPGEVKIYQRDASDAWRVTQVIHSPAKPTSGISFTNDWRYNPGGGVWQVDGTHTELGFPMTSRLNSVSTAVPENCVSAFGCSYGDVILSFRHRWSFEQNERGGFDGGQVRISVNGGPYVTIPRGAFTQNPYNGAVSATSASELRGQASFIAQSAGYSSRTRVTSTCNLGRFGSQTSLSIQFLYGGDSNTRAIVPNWEIDSVDLEIEFFDSIGVSGRHSLFSHDFDTDNGGFTVQTESPLAPDRFGFSLAIRNGWLAIGAPRDDQAALQAGAVHLYQKINSPDGTATFDLRETILSPGAQAEAAFGTSVSLKGSDLFVGSPRGGINAMGRKGAVYQFRRGSNSWLYSGQLAQPLGSQAEFGARVVTDSQLTVAGSRFSQLSASLTNRLFIQRWPSAQLRILLGFDRESVLIATGPSDRTYFLQTTTNLLTAPWENVQAGPLALPATNTIDIRQHGNPQRFFRLTSP